MNLLILFFSLSIFSINPDFIESPVSSNPNCTRTKAVKTKNENGISTTYWKYKYDGEGRVKRRDLYYEFTNKRKWAFEFEYDKNDNVIKRTRYDENNEYDGYYTLEYVNNVLTKESRYDTNDKVLFWKEYFNNNGKPNRFKYFNENGKLSEYWTFEYNEQGQNSIKKLYLPNGTLSSVFYMYYNQNGLENRYIRTDAEGNEMYSYYYSYECE